MSKTKIWLLFFLALPAWAANSIFTTEGSWTDAARSREIPYKIYAPQNPTGRCPVIFFSHGLGGSREGYAYLGSFWASNGYVVIHVQHIGSDEAVWRGTGGPANVMKAMNESALNPKNALDRPRDISFAIGQLASLETNAALRGHIDTNRIGVAGHSFGASTTMAVAGAGAVFRDPRVEAAIAMSTPTPNPVTDATMSGVKIPVLHMTGTQDTSPVGRPQKAEDRRTPFDHSHAADSYLVVFNGGKHMLFSGREGFGSQSSDEHNHRLIREGTLAFWNAYLRDDAQAKAWLQNGGYSKALGDAATFEEKIPGKN